MGTRMVCRQGHDRKKGEGQLANADRIVQPHAWRLAAAGYAGKHLARLPSIPRIYCTHTFEASTPIAAPLAHAGRRCVTTL